MMHVDLPCESDALHQRVEGSTVTGNNMESESESPLTQGPRATGGSKEFGTQATNEKTWRQINARSATQWNCNEDLLQLVRNQ